MQTPQPEFGPELETLWIRQIAGGDRGAFEKLYHAYERRIYRYLYSLVRTTEAAEELTNDVMVEAWKAAPSFRAQSKPSAWLFGIAHHKAMDALRRRRPSVVELHALSAVADSQESPEDSAVRQSVRRSVAEALQSLSAEHRSVVELTFNHGYSYQEIARIVGCPLNTVKTRMFYAKKQLRQVFARWGGQREIS